jgi:hypothetical protein
LWKQKKTFEQAAGLGDGTGVRAATRCLIVAVTICSWLALSNHCAFGALTAKRQTTQSSCPFHSKPAKPQQQSIACCKTLRALGPAAVKNFSPAVVDFVFSEIAVGRPPKISFAPATLDTGPPGKTSFVAFSGNVRAHAPPIFV